MNLSKIGGLLAQVAPTVATALGGPLAGLAVKTLSEAMFGHQDASESDVSAALMNATPDQLQKLKEIDASFKTRMKELDIDLEAIAAEDRKSARSMMTMTGAQTPAILSYSVIIAWVFIQYYLFTTVIDPSMRELIARVLGTLDGALMLVLSFWFGSSSGSHAKDQTINDLRAKQ
jgi:hypothetical protein